MAAGKLDRRTLAICACISVIAACLAGLLAWVLIGDDDEPTPGQVTLAAPSEGLMGVPLDVPDGAAQTNLEVMGGGRPMLVNFWQSTCVPCIEEMPLLEQARIDNAGIVFVGVNSEETLERAQEMATQTGITYPWVLDPTGDAFHAAKGAGMPTTILVEPDGTILGTETGAFDDLAEVQAFIDEHLG